VSEPAPERLDSWKDIALYLRRDVSTVQRWEKREGMPVHRHQHDKAGSVYAYASELDAWLQSRRGTLDARSGTEASPGGATGPQPHSRRHPFPVRVGCQSGGVCEGAGVRERAVHASPPLEEFSVMSRES
jgi:hypothetical protein